MPIPQAMFLHIYPTLTLFSDLNGTSLSTSPKIELREHWERRGGKNIRAGEWGVFWHAAFGSWHCHHTVQTKSQWARLTFWFFPVITDLGCKLLITYKACSVITFHLMTFFTKYKRIINNNHNHINTKLSRDAILHIVSHHLRLKHITQIHKLCSYK